MKINLYKKMQKFKLAHSPFWAFGATSLVVIIFWIALPAEYKVNESSDYLHFYEPVAENLMKGNGFVLDNGSLAIRYPPGYPLILAVIFKTALLFEVPRTTILSAFIVVFYSGSSLFLFLLAKSIYNEAVALLVSALWITYPFGLWITKQPNSEIPFLFMFWGTFYLYWRVMSQAKSKKGGIFVVGILLGMLMLIRPIAIGLPFIFAFFVWVIPHHQVLPTRMRRLQLSVILLLGSLLVVFPWQWRLQAETDEFYLLSSGGLPSIIDGITFGVNEKYREEISLSEDLLVIMRHYDRTHKSGELGTLSKFVVYTREHLSNNPLLVAKLVGYKALRSWYATDSQRFEKTIMIVQSCYLGLILLGITKLKGINHKDRIFFVFILSVAFYFWGMTTIVLSILRYMIPVMGLLILLIPLSYPKFLRYQLN